MKRVSWSLPLAFLVAPAAQSQENPFAMAPAEEVGRWDVAIGSWEGGGGSRFEPGGEEFPWTGRSTVQYVLGGHFVQEDTLLQTAGGPMSMHVISGWDRERDRFVHHNFSDMGSAGMNVSWLDDRTLHAWGAASLEGVPLLERWTTTYGEDSFTFAMEQSFGGAPFFQSAWGEFQRAETAIPLEELQRTGAAEPGEELARLARIRGRYEVAGSFSAPGMPAMDITAEEQVDWILGGSVLLFDVRGQPGDYLGRGYLYWDEVEGGYVHFGVNSMGVQGTLRMQLVPGSMVFNGVSVEMGVRGVTRIVSSLADDGSLSRVVGHRIDPTGDPYKNFEATYTRIGDAGAVGADARPASFEPGSCCARAAGAGGACEHPCCVTAAGKGEVCAACN